MGDIAFYGLMVVLHLAIGLLVFVNFLSARYGRSPVLHLAVLMLYFAGLRWAFADPSSPGGLLGRSLLLLIALLAATALNEWLQHKGGSVAQAVDVPDEV